MKRFDIDAAIPYFKQLLENNQVTDYARDCNRTAFEALSELKREKVNQPMAIEMRVNGAYVEYDHKPTAEDVAEATQVILKSVLNDTRGADMFTSVQVIIHEVGKKIYACDPLADIPVPADKKGHWTVGLKIRSWHGRGEKRGKTDLQEGVAPEPMAVEHVKEGE